MIAALVGLTGATAFGQFEGPAPIAWRWAQNSSVPPGGPPVVVGDTVYVAAGQRIYALDRESGNQKWRYPAGEPLQANFRSGLSLAGNTLIAAADNKLVYAVDATTGQPVWSPYAAPDPIQGPVLATGKFAVFALGGSSIMAINVETGEPIWTNPQRIFAGIVGSIGVSEGNVLVFDNKNTLYSIDIATQKVSWQRGFTTIGAAARPVVFGGAIYINTGDFLTVISAATGTPRWQKNVGQPLDQNPSVTADGVSVVTREGRLFAFDASGAPINRKGIELGSVAIVDPAQLGKLTAVCMQNGTMTLIDPKAGSTVWSFPVRAMSAPTDPKQSPYVAAAAPPVLSGTTLLLFARDGSLLAFDRAFGVDLTPPRVKMAFPNPGDQISGQPPLDIVFSLEDEASGINPSTIKVEIDGQEQDTQLTRENYLFVRISSAAPKNKPLSNGRKSIVVTVSDWMGNIQKTNFALTIDNTLLPAGRPATTSGGNTGGGDTMSGGKGGGGGG